MPLSQQETAHYKALQNRHALYEEQLRELNKSPSASNEEKRLLKLKKLRIKEEMEVL